MNRNTHKGRNWKKILLITFGVLFAFVALVIAFISPIAKWAIEKYDEQILGRQITLDWIYLNPFTGYAHINDITIFEANKDTAFVSAGGIDVNFAMFKLIGKTYEISNLTISDAEIHLKQNKDTFNFSDILTRFAPKDTLNKDTTKTHFNLLDIKVKNTRFYYFEPNIPVNYFITDLNISSPGMRWDNDSINAKLSFKNGPGTGDIAVDFGFNLKTMEYAAKAKIKKFDMYIINEYLKDIADFGIIRANVDADVDAKGNFNNTVALTTKGYVAINDFHFGKNMKEDYASFDKVEINMIKVSPRTFDYVFDTISIQHPFFKYERYDSLDNLSRMFGVNGENYTEAKAKSDAGQFNLIVSIVDFLKELGKNFAKSHYSANRFALRNGDIHFNDYSLRDKFGAAVSPFNILADSIDRKNDLLKVNINSDIKPHGNLNIDFAINPSDFSDFTIGYAIDKIALPDFNPYVVTYTSFPLKSGTLSLKGSWVVRDSAIKSMNHLVILAPEKTKRIRKNDAKWLPLPLILSILREPGNYIDYEIPIEGKLTDPKFKVKDVVLDILKNIFVKPPTYPYRAYVDNKKDDVEEFQAFSWNMRQVELNNSQQHFMDELTGFLKKNTDAVVTINPVVFSAKEKENILLYLAKKKYYLQMLNKSASNYTTEDSVEVEKMSVKSDGFITALNRSIDGSNLMFTVQEKCSHWIDSATVNSEYAAINKKRAAIFKTAFEQEGVVNQLVIKTEQTDFPRNGFSYYKITYSVDIPDKLRKALEQLDLNEGPYIKGRRH